MAARRIAALLPAALACVMSGCGGGDGSGLAVTVIGTPGTPSAANEPTSFAARLVRSATAEGLVAFDEKGRVVPALADRWIVFDDGESYIFRLRDGTWRDGEPLTAASAQAALHTAITRANGTALGFDLAVIDTIRVMAARVIEIRLKQPMPDLLQLLAQPEMGLLHRGQGAGPMLLTPAPQGSTLVPIEPSSIGLAAVSGWNRRVRHIGLATQTGQTAVSRFSGGDADLLLGGRVDSFPLAATLGISRGTIQLDPVSGLFGLAVLQGRGVLASAATREALAMAIDRDALVQAFNIGGWLPTTRIVPGVIEDDPGTAGERWVGMTLDDRRRQARATIARALAGKPAPAVVVALPGGPGSDLLFDRLRQDFATVGVGLVRVAERTPADLALVDQVARYPRTAWFMNMFNCAVHQGRARAGLCDVGADALMEQVRGAADAATASRLLAEALASLTQANVFIPLAAPLRWSLVRGDVTGFSVNSAGVHPLMPMALAPQ